jgi:uncharacterized membrane protein YphA (DoxX/SURF4 family)
MSLLRFAARSMLASYFVVNGVKAVRHPDDFAETAQQFTEKVLPALKSALPQEASSLLPVDETGVARICGGVQIVGGLCLATGIGRRLGAGLLASAMVPQILASHPLKAASDDRVKFGAEVALLGAVVVAALDTEGEPGLAWRLRAHRELASKKTAQRKAEAARSKAAIATGANQHLTATRKLVESVLS